MQGYSNLDTISLHITDSCNIRCKGCYLGEFRTNKEIDLNYIDKAIEKLHPKNIVFFGGEALLRPKILESVMDKYPDLKYVVHTNGTIYNERILDRIDSIAMTIDGISYEYIHATKGINTRQYANFEKILNNYTSKIVVTHNILPSHNEPDFSKKIAKYNIPVDWYVLVTYEKEQEYLSEFDTVYPINGINTFPKIRVLMNGMITRDMTDHYNLAHLDNWKSSLKLKELPISSKCRSCEYFKKCHACNMFPHFCKNVLDNIDYIPHFCKFTKMFWDRKRG